MVSLYDSDFGGTLDALRAYLFVSIKGDMRCLPPTEDAFLLHLRWVLHQLAVCKRAHMVQPAYPAATGFGRQLANGILVAKKLCQKRQNLLNSNTANTAAAMCARGCSCARANVKCGIACLCTGDPTDVQGLNLLLHLVNLVRPMVQLFCSVKVVIVVIWRNTIMKVILLYYISCVTHFHWEDRVMLKF